MFVMKNHGFKRKYVYGGAGIFDSLAKLFTSGIAKQLTSTAIDVGKEVGKKTAIDVGTKLVKNVLTPNSQKALQKYPDAVATNVQNILKYVTPQLPVRQKYHFTHRWVGTQCYCHTGPSPKITWIRSENCLK